MYSRLILFLLAVAMLSALHADDETTTGSTKQSKPAQKLDPQHAEKFAAGLKLFKSNVRKILVDRCLSCHGGDVIEGEFDISTREKLLKGGVDGAVVDLENPANGRLLNLVTHKEQPFMPYEEEKLPAEEIAALTKWIELGAPYTDALVETSTAEAVDWTERKVPDSAKRWWAFQPLRKIEPPDVRHEEQVRNPIDRFILARLEEQGISMNPQADERKLVRRAFFDLVGLPPTPEEIDEYLQDSSPDAYRNMLDRLLANEHYGERWGRHWLDVARFAESHGFEQDYNREYAYHFRDFVIQALNADMPYDQFVRWQLAGDEFAPNDPLAMMATGFLGAGVFPTQITKNEVERTRYDALDDMAATTGAAFLGLTVGCARCHDHKFDPIPQADYYRLISTFTTTVRANIDLDLHPEKYRQEKAKWDQAHAPLAAALQEFEREELPSRFEAWLKNRPKETTDQTGWILLDLLEYRSAGDATFQRLEDGSLLATGENPKFDTYTLTARTNVTGIRSIRLEALADDSLQKKGPGRAGNGNFALSDFRVTARPATGDAKETPVKLVNPRATFEQKGLPAKATIDGDAKSSWAIDPEFGKDHAIAFDIEGEFGFDAGTVLTFTLKFENNTGHNIGRPRLSFGLNAEMQDLHQAPANQAPVEIAALLSKLDSPPNDSQRTQLLQWYRLLDPEWQKRNAAAQAHAQLEPQPNMTKVMVTSEGVTPIRHHTQGGDFLEATHFLYRGECDRKVREAQPGFLQVLTDSPDGPDHWKELPPEGGKTSYRRRSLANWITDTEQGAGHLLARVIVNRIWQHHMGRGIVTTPNDFGRQGELPTHPDLLDWLAAELIRENWQLKPIHKLIMTSAVYRQNSDRDPAKLSVDRENRLYWRHTPHRLEAEVIRDSMLSVSQLLDPTMFGPGTLDESHKRRSIYFMVKRSKLVPMMQLFDSPEPLVSVGQRPSTTVAPQALMFMNNPQVREYARGFAKRVQGDDGRIQRAYLIAIGRPPTEEERTAATEFLQEQQKSYDDSNATEAELLALTDFCQVLMSMNEFVYAE